MAYLYDMQRIQAIMTRYGNGNLYPREVKDQWALFDRYYKKEHTIQWPKVVLDGEKARFTNSLARLELRFNFGKTIVHATETMVLSGGFKVFNDRNVRDSKAEEFLRLHKDYIKRLVHFMSRYGAGWVHAVPLERVPFRFYRPHDAIEITAPEDPQKVEAVLLIQEAKEIEAGPSGYAEVTYEYARWYEWNDDRDQVRILHFRRRMGTGLIADPSGNPAIYDWQQVEKPGVPATLPYMPLVLARNRIEDTLPEASDLSEAIPILQGFDDLSSKWNKAMEDEAFRQTFFAGVGQEQMMKMMEMGSHVFLFAKQAIGEHLPQMQVAPPSSLDPYINGFIRLLKSLSTVTRTSPLELDERPVQDIPAQTLRVLMGPQLERCTDTALAASRPLSLVVQAKQTGSVDSDPVYRLILEPQVPVAKEAEVNNLVSQLQAKGISQMEFLRQRGYTEEQAAKIVAETDADKRKEMELERESRIDVERAKAEAIAAARTPIPAG